jgi:hypothetical protein
MSVTVYRCVLHSFSCLFLEPPELKPRLDLVNSNSLDDDLLAGRADKHCRGCAERVDVAVDKVLLEVVAEGLGS